MAVQTGMQALASGGTFVLVGMGATANCCNFPNITLVTKEADVKGCFRYTNTVRRNVAHPSQLSAVSTFAPPLQALCSSLMSLSHRHFVLIRTSSAEQNSRQVVALSGRRSAHGLCENV